MIKKLIDIQGVRIKKLSSQLLEIKNEIIEIKDLKSELNSKYNDFTKEYDKYYDVAILEDVFDSADYQKFIYKVNEKKKEIEDKFKVYNDRRESLEKKREDILCRLKRIKNKKVKYEEISY
ncbi:hypothetical protein BW450_19930 [Salmonella enterica]|nr:hypothetical protein [Salmonella enterica]